MTRLLAIVVTCSLAVAIALPRSGQAADRPQTEAERIEALISHVEELAGAKFVRNGVEYDAKTAGKFLRAKWEARMAQIRTAQDFIDQVATKSSTTGKPYLIRFKEGKESKSGEYLMEQLKKLEMSRHS